MSITKSLSPASLIIPVSHNEEEMACDDTSCTGFSLLIHKDADLHAHAREHERTDPSSLTCSHQSTRYGVLVAPLCRNPLPPILLSSLHKKRMRMRRAAYSWIASNTLKPLYEISLKRRKRWSRHLLWRPSSQARVTRQLQSRSYYSSSPPPRTLYESYSTPSLQSPLTKYSLSSLLMCQGNSIPPCTAKLFQFPSFAKGNLEDHCVWESSACVCERPCVCERALEWVSIRVCVRARLCEWASVCVCEKACVCVSERGACVRERACVCE